MMIRLIGPSDYPQVVELQNSSRLAALANADWPVSVGYIQWMDVADVASYMNNPSRFATGEFLGTILRSMLVIDVDGNSWHVDMRLELPGLSTIDKARIFVDWVHFVMPLIVAGGITTISGRWPHGKMLNAASFLISRGATLTISVGDFDTMIMPISALAAVP